MILNIPNPIELYKKFKQTVKNKKLIVLSQIHSNNTKELLKVQSRFNTVIEKSIKDYNTIVIDNENRDEIVDISSVIVDYDTYVNKTIDFFKTLFKDSKRIYYPVIILKNGNIKSFKVYEDMGIKGFKRTGCYYSLDKQAVLMQKNKAFIFFLEDYSAPINFKSARFVKDELGTEHEMELSSRNLIDVVDGKAFKGIMSLGKGDGGFKIDWIMIAVSVGIIMLGILHATGQIDLMTMLAIK